MFIDAHNHILDYLEEHYKKDDFGESEIFQLYPDSFKVAFCASSNEKKRFIKQKQLCNLLQENIKKYYSFGIHPQKPEMDELDFLEKLLSNREISCIGESGFDLFNDEYRATIEEQKEVWNIQVELAIKYGVPLIIHCRSALHLIFASAKQLAKVKAVIFHGYAGSSLEASSLLKRGINAYFCIGKALLRGQKSQINMARNFDIHRILTETDAPYMRLKNEEHTALTDIEKVASAITHLRCLDISTLNSILGNTFNQIFNF